MGIGFPQEGRYVDNGDGTISDLATGLMWQKETAVPEWSEEDGPAVTYGAALEYAAQLRLAGSDDWRIPNVFEIWSVLKLDWRGRWGEGWFPEPFTRLSYPYGSGTYWNSTSPMLDVCPGGSIMGNMGRPRDVHLVRCVRGGTTPGETVLPATGAAHGWDPEGNDRELFGNRLPGTDPRVAGQDGQTQFGCPIEGRYVDHGDGTITDLCTGLMWEKTPGFVDGDEYGRTTWQGALQYARDLGLAGYDDWRVPNASELVFILDWWHTSDWRESHRYGTDLYPFEFRPRLMFWTSSASQYDLFRIRVSMIGVHSALGVTNSGESCDYCKYLVRCVRGPIWLEGE